MKDTLYNLEMNILDLHERHDWFALMVYDSLSFLCPIIVTRVMFGYPSGLWDLCRLASACRVLYRVQSRRTTVILHLNITYILL